MTTETVTGGPVEATGTLEAINDGRIWIDLGIGHCRVRESDIVAVWDYEPAEDNGDPFLANYVADMRLVRSLVRTKYGHTFASSLNWREIGNRLRRAGGTIV